eukprot:CAMPEP_0178440502 /NCGR_PEP_ID=MMETSP0689_2-20121128/36828_1 /TAXON_ID=160604 /ORGANISM="Amphidinium massartii, Strain CS-259" /LENGTH=130 /DNA_ID=CAMNT_0020063311 /DNA_START=335 /DNA_END=723 /DNA_ORIENTATION=-
MAEAVAELAPPPGAVAPAPAHWHSDLQGGLWNWWLLPCQSHLSPVPPEGLCLRMAACLASAFLRSQVLAPPPHLCALVPAAVASIRGLLGLGLRGAESVLGANFCLPVSRRPGLASTALAMTVWMLVSTL